MMDLNLNDEERMLVDSATRWAAESYAFPRRLATVDAGGHDQAAWQEIAEMGWLALTVPEAAGGLGLSIHHMMLLMTGVGRGLLVEPLIGSAVIAARALAACDGNAAADLLGQVATGEAIAALAAPERGTTGGPAIRAARSGDGYVLDGAVVLVAEGSAATHFLVATELAGATALFLVPRDTPGLTVETYMLIDGRGAADLTCRQVALGADALLLADAAGAVDDALDDGLAAELGAAVGALEACVELTVTHLKERKQFGQALAEFQALRHIAAEMFVETHQARSMLYYLLSQVGKPGWAAAVSEARLLIGEMGLGVTRRANQLHGAIAFTEEFHIGHYYKRMLSLTGLYGGEEFHQQRAAQTSIVH